MLIGVSAPHESGGEIVDSFLSFEAGHHLVRSMNMVARVSGVSGTTASRPRLDGLMADAAKGLRDIGTLVTVRLDRFGRSVQHLYSAVGKLLDAKVEFVSVKDNFDLTTPMGKLLLGILAVFAEFERNVIAERTKDGLKKARAEGHRGGRRIDPEKGPSRTTRGDSRSARGRSPCSWSRQP